MIRLCLHSSQATINRIKKPITQENILEEGNTPLAVTAERFTVSLFKVQVTAAGVVLRQTQKSFEMDDKNHCVSFKIKHYSK